MRIVEAAPARESVASCRRPDGTPTMPGTPSGFTCPECGGALWELHDHGLVEFRCRVGHEFSAGWLLTEQSEALESELLVALRTLKEREELARRLTTDARERRDAAAATRFAEQAQDAERRAALVEEALLPTDPETSTAP